MTNIDFDDEGDIIHQPEEFGKCPFHKLFRKDSSRSYWSLSRGGHPIKDREWAISIFKTNENNEIVSLNQHRWIIPDFLVYLFEKFYEDGQRDKSNSLKRAFDCNKTLYEY